MKFNKGILLAGAVLLGLAACEQEAKQPTDAEIDKLVNEKVEARKAEMQQLCDERIMEMASLKADSMMVAAGNKPARVVTAPAPAPKPAAKKKVTKKVTKPQPKKETKPSNTNRPGANGGGSKASNTSRPGANNSGANKTNGSSNSNRPGASNSNRPGANK